jgi:hypothetical protein
LSEKRGKVMPAGKRSQPVASWVFGYFSMAGFAGALGTAIAPNCCPLF